MTARDRIIAEQLAQIDQWFEDNVREFWTRTFDFAGDDGEVELENCDQIVADLRTRQAAFRATLARDLAASMHEDGSWRPGCGIWAPNWTGPEG